MAKKAVNWTIICLGCVVLIWGVVASIMSLQNSKNANLYIAAPGTAYNYAKDGKRTYVTEIPEADQYRYVQTTEAEVINYVEYLKRVSKYNKSLWTKQKQN